MKAANSGIFGLAPVCAAGFLCVPLVTSAVLSGKFTGHALETSVIFISLPILAAAAAFKNKTAAAGIIIIGLCVFTAYVSSVYAVVSGKAYAEKILSMYGGTETALEGYVEKSDSSPDESLFVCIEKINGNALEKPVSVYAYNRTGHFLCEGLYISFNACLRAPQGRNENPDSASGVLKGTFSEKTDRTAALTAQSSRENTLIKQNGFALDSWLKGKGVYIEAYNLSGLSAVNSENAGSTRKSMVEAVFSGVDRVLEHISDTQEYLRAKALASALMFGDKSGFSESDLTNFRRSGITHILCVSGIHFSVLLGALGKLLSIFVMRKKPRTVILAAASAVYLYMCAFTASALRSAIMAFIASSGIAGDNRNKTSLSLLAAVAVMCAVNPNIIYDTGFHLSALSCVGIACSAGVGTFLKHKFAFRPALSFFCETLNMSLASFAFTFAYSITAFSGISVVSAAASLAAVFPAQICLVICWIFSVVGYAGIYPLSFAAGSIINQLSGVIFSIAEFFGNLPGAYVNKELPNISYAVFLAGLLAAFFTSSGLVKGAKIYYAALVSALSFVTIIMILSV